MDPLLIAVVCFCGCFVMAFIIYAKDMGIKRAAKHFLVALLFISLLSAGFYFMSVKYGG